MQVENTKPYKFFKHHPIEDEECNVIDSYDNPDTIQAYIYPASGSLEASVYGEELKYVLKLLTNEDVLSEKDGVCVYIDDEPDYRVVAIRRYSEHLEMDIKKI